MNTQDHREEMCFDVTKLESYDLILDYSWLKQHNPNIDWLEEKVQHWNCDCPLVPEAQRLRADHHAEARDKTTMRD